MNKAIIAKVKEKKKYVAYKYVNSSSTCCSLLLMNVKFNSENLYIRIGWNHFLLFLGAATSE